MLDVSHLNAIVLVFGMTGCSACEDYVPRLKAVAKEFPEVDIYDENSDKSKRKRKVPIGTLPIFFYDVNSSDQALQTLADQYQVSAMPTTIALIRYRDAWGRLQQGALRYEGSISDGQIRYVLKETVSRI